MIAITGFHSPVSEVEGSRAIIGRCGTRIRAVRKWHRVSKHSTLVAICTVALILRCHELNNRSLWFDEAFSWRIVGFPWNEIVHRIAADNHPPLHSPLLKGWMAVFGESVAARTTSGAMTACRQRETKRPAQTHRIPGSFDTPYVFWREIWSTTPQRTATNFPLL